MSKREDLILAEDERWEQLSSLLEELPEDRMLEPGVAGEWSAKDLLAHIGCWMAEAARNLEQMRMGTWEQRRLDIDAMNREFVEAFRDADLELVRVEMEAARIRMLQEWHALSEISGAAEEWFVESGPAHLEEHLPQLRRFAETSRGP